MRVAAGTHTDEVVPTSAYHGDGGRVQSGVGKSATSTADIHRWWCRRQRRWWRVGGSCDITYLIMPLPDGIDLILGMDFFVAQQVWLHPATKRVLVVDGRAKRPEKLQPVRG